tara:strand:+ start:1841 stop:2029 length:189 start_codon:yes stop_codon:yes gene_type:complete
MGSKMDDAIDAAIAGSERRRARQATATTSSKKKKKPTTSIIKEGIKSIRKGHKRTTDAADKY